MNKKGFTLTEVLVVIVLISLIVAIAVPSVLAVNRRINQRLLESKKDMILAAAELYGRDNPQLFVSDEFLITVGELIDEGYVEADADYGEGACDDTYGCAINPVNKNSLNDEVILVKREGKGVIAVWDGTLGSTSNKDLVDAVKDKLQCGEITESKPCLFVGNDVDNYLWYSGVMWRIIGVYKIDGKEVVKMVTDDNISFEVTNT